jgi:hypothetical protein
MIIFCPNCGERKLNIYKEKGQGVKSCTTCDHSFLIIETSDRRFDSNGVGVKGSKLREDRG